MGISLVQAGRQRNGQRRILGPCATPVERIVNRRQSLKCVALAGLVIWAPPIGTVAAAEPKSAASRPASSIPAASLIQPAELAALLRGPANPKPLILQVGFRTLYDQAHIPGAEFAGTAGGDEGLQMLRARIAKLPKDAFVVIYCGCCPWSHCPNIAAAFEALHGAGLTRVKVMYIANNFGSDWVDKDYPVEKAP
jgi:thiosulfate/3-mercaptopyruvate sulfurtransferase